MLRLPARPPARSRRRPHAGHAGSPGPGTAGAPQADARRPRPGPRRTAARRIRTSHPANAARPHRGRAARADTTQGSPAARPACACRRRGPACPRGRGAAWQVIHRGRKRGVAAVPRDQPLQAGDPRARSAFSASSCAILLSRSASKVSSSARDNGSYPVTQPRSADQRSRRTHRGVTACRTPAHHRSAVSTARSARDLNRRVARHSSWTRGDTPSEQDRNRNSLAGGGSSVNVLASDLPGGRQLSSGPGRHGW